MPKKIGFFFPCAQHPKCSRGDIFPKSQTTAAKFIWVHKIPIKLLESQFGVHCAMFGGIRKLPEFLDVSGKPFGRKLRRMRFGNFGLDVVKGK